MKKNKYKKNKQTKVCVIVPFRNEEANVKSCLKSLLKFRVPKGFKYTILCLDGGSSDGSKKIIENIIKKYDNIKYIYNKKLYHVCAVNLAVRSFNADYYLWLGSHTIFPANYLKTCLETSKRTGAQVVGGICNTLPGGNSYGAKVVQAITTHKFGVGNSGFRLGVKEGKRDTVPYALFAKEAFLNGGYLDERLIRAQDFEFNRRLSCMGMKIWLNPEIYCFYRNQPNFWGFINKQLLLEAPYNAYMWFVAPYSFAYRHAITGFFAAGILGGIVLASIFPKAIGVPLFVVMVLYIILAFLSSIQQAIRYKEIRHIFFLPSAFFFYHFIHGLGLLTGLLRLATFTAPVQKIKEPWPGAGFYRVPIRKSWLSKNNKMKTTANH